LHGALDAQGVVLLPDEQRYGVASQAMQVLHGAHGELFDVQSGFDQVAQLEQAQAQSVAAGARAFNHLANGQVVQNAMGC
jgi:hypothetical protein